MSKLGLTFKWSCGNKKKEVVYTVSNENVETTSFETKQEHNLEKDIEEIEKVIGK